MNGTRANRRKHEYRGGQWTRDLLTGEEKELSRPEYSIGAKDRGRVLPFDETGVPYTKNYINNKEAFDALDKARFETEVPLWPRNKDGTRQTFADLQKNMKLSGDGAKDAAEAKVLNTFYPHQAGGLFCSAPFCKGERAFRSESAESDPNEDLLVCQALGISELRSRIMNNLSYHDIGSLQGTCTNVANQVMGTPALWDMSHGGCNYSEFTAEEFEVLKECGDAEKDDQQGNNEFLMISPTHMGYDEGHGLRDYPNNVAQVQSVLIMGRGLHLRGHTIKRVCFNRVNFFDSGVFGTYLDLMPNLERADITNCDLIRYHHVPYLLDIVKAYNKRHGHKLLFDVSPRYNYGPLWENGKRKDGWSDGYDVVKEDRQGTYGLTYSNPGVRIPPAVVKVYIYDIAPRMKQSGQMHMMESNALFRRFLEKLPLHSKAVPRMEAVAEHKEYLKRLFAKGKISEDDKARLQIRCTFAERDAIFGDEGHIQLYEDGIRSTTEKGTPFRYGLWGDTANCADCKTHLALMYCTTGYACDGCQMAAAVSRDDYHWKKLKSEATQYLGCHHEDDDPIVPLGKTNIDFSVLRDARGNSRIQRLSDFENLLAVEVPKIRRMMNHARKMDIRGYTGLNIPDLVVQKRHRCDRVPDNNDTQRDLLRLVYYRHAVPLEVMQKFPNGRTDRMVGQF
ncbi:hypothetical protein KVR01_010375 [Diaporthe batatas]|uniref:uncharacterized protein n=1 Tax=Diaporthe batatas TaxID=748121 RepID=UPI001D05071C|nr:uncharacterized protein KVR01_010375 [Diaporthe batatas]KAG8159738.1 hypothetical protein KVR01_010375 [Diaporthe batatas]